MVSPTGVGRCRQTLSRSLGIIGLETFPGRRARRGTSRRGPPVSAGSASRCEDETGAPGARSFPGPPAPGTSARSVRGERERGRRATSRSPGRLLQKTGRSPRPPPQPHARGTHVHELADAPGAVPGGRGSRMRPGRRGCASIQCPTRASRRQPTAACRTLKAGRVENQQKCVRPQRSVFDLVSSARSASQHEYSRPAPPLTIRLRS